MQIRERGASQALCARWLTYQRLFYGLLLCAASTPIWSQQVAPPVLTIEDAVSQAVEHNSTLANDRLETRRVKADLAANRTKRYFSTSISGQGSQLITQPQISFAAGSLGTYPGTGPIPGTDTTITIPRNFTGLLSASVSQPLTTQIQLHFQLRSLALGVEETKQDELKQKLQTIDDTRRAYYSVVQAQAELSSASASLPLYRETVRLTEKKVRQETALPSDLLRAKAQLVQAENSKSSADDQFATAQEKLNDLMGRDIHSQFQVSEVSDVDDLSDSQASLEERALHNRPDVRKSRLDVEKTGFDVRAKKAEYIPNISGSVSYYTTFNFGNTLPSNIGLAGLSLSWEPFDWGRKRHELVEKRTQQDEAKVTLTQTERTALMDVSSARRALLSAKRDLALSNANQQANRETLRETQEQVQREEKLPQDLFQAESNLASADSQHAKALAQFWQALADLKKAIGEE